MTTAVLSAAAGLLEIRAATLILQGNKVAAATWMRWAGVLSLAAGLIEGVYLFYKGGTKVAGKDYDSGSWTIGTGAFVAMGGFASFAAATTGATATTLLGFGPVGWTLIALGLLGAGLYCSWQAWATDDANLLPVEYWLDNGVFGKKRFINGDALANNPYTRDGKVEPFKSLDLEVKALQQVLFVAQSRMWTAQDSKGIGLMCFYDVALPRYDVGTKLEIIFTGIDEGRCFEAGRIVCENGKAQPTKAHIEPRLTGMREGPTLKHDPKAGTLRIEGFFSTMQDPTLVNKAFDRFGWHKDTNVYADSFVMDVRYWPDQVNLPDLAPTQKVPNR